MTPEEWMVRDFDAELITDLADQLRAIKAAAQEVIADGRKAGLSNPFPALQAAVEKIKLV